MSEAFMPSGAGSIEILCDRGDDCMDAGGSTLKGIKATHGAVAGRIP